MLLFTMAVLNLSVVEIIVLQLGAVILGIAIHFFIISRRSLTGNPSDAKKLTKQFEDWKMKFFSETELREKELAEAKLLTKQAEENGKMNLAELEDLRRQNKKLKTELDLINEEPNPGNELELEIERLNNQLTKIELRNEELNDQLSKMQQQLKIKQNELEKKNIPAIDEEKQREIEILKQKLNEATSINNTFKQKAEDLENQLKVLQVELENKINEPATAGEHKGEYLGQLRQAQVSLLEHNQKINQLLGQIDMVKENEEKQQQILLEKEELQSELNQLQNLLGEKEDEIIRIREKEKISAEMSSMLENAYSEFHVLQNKLHRMENQVSASKLVTIEFENIKEGHARLAIDFEQQKLKLNEQILENQRLTAQVNNLEDQNKEINFHRQQLQKRINYLEEINQDLQTMSEANKKLENKLKNIGELESKLNIMAEERDQLLRRQMGHI